MYERKKGRQSQELASISGWSGGNRISTVHERNKLDSTTYFYTYDRGAWRSRVDFDIKELIHSSTIIIVSVGGFGIGVGLILERIFG